MTPLPGPEYNHQLLSDLETFHDAFGLVKQPLHGSIRQLVDLD